MITKEYINKQFLQLNDKNFDIDTLDKTGRSLLFLACKICDFEKIKLLVQLGCNLNVIDNVGYNCLLTVCNISQKNKNENIFAIVKYFIEECNINPLNFVTNKNESCLYLACKSGNYEIVEYLLNNYSELLEIKTENDVSCLEIAIFNNYELIFDLLLKFGANPNEINNETGLSCLMTASCNKRYTMVKKLIDSGADYDFVNFKNRNCLYYAAYRMHGNDETIEYLLSLNIFVCDRTFKLLSQSENQKILSYLCQF